MSLIRFEIRHPDGRKEVANVDGERALIGSGAHCDIRLPLDQAANEHVAVEVVGETARVESRAMEPPATVNGMPFTNMPVAPDVPLKIGQTRIFIALGEVGIEGAPILKKKTEETSPFMKVLGVLVLVCGAYMVLVPEQSAEAPAPTQLVDPFLATPTVCPQKAPDQALSFAMEKFDLAQGKRERSPFSPKEGVQAVQLYELAKVCFQQAGDNGQAAEAATATQQLRDAILLDFRTRRVRLEHLLALGDNELAKTDIIALHSLTDGKQGKYVEWLNARYQEMRQRGGRP
ncbi:MAG TPA: FHA domain-containing protein [Polyangiaceae bacterium]|jgi:hypothetical protein